MTTEQINKLVERSLHTVEADVRIRIAASSASTCAIEPSALAHLLSVDPAAAWLTLAGLTSAQLTVQAIDYTAWLNETSGRDLHWYAILEVFEARIAKLMHPSEAA